MKTHPRILPLLLIALVPACLLAQDSTALYSDDGERDHEAYIDSLIGAFAFVEGEAKLAEGAATLTVPPGYKFLGAEQAEQLVVEVWENPPGIAEDLLGVVMPADAGVYDDVPSYILYYERIGYVRDEDADGIDYDAKLKEMLREDSIANEQRRADGYGSLLLVGWAAPPYYDKERKALHWAKEMVSESSDRNVLNYNIRILGRHGVLVINAVSGMDHLEMVQAELPLILGMARFNDGHRYEQFDPATDAVADQGLDGLIDGKTRERVKEVIGLAVKVAIGAFLGLLLLLIGIWFLFIRKRR